VDMMYTLTFAILFVLHRSFISTVHAYHNYLRFAFCWKTVHCILIK